MLCADTKNYGKADRNFEFIGEDKDRHFESLRKEHGNRKHKRTSDEAERLQDRRRIVNLRSEMK